MSTNDIEVRAAGAYVPRHAAPDAGGLYATAARAMAEAATADDLLTVLHGIHADYRATALGTRGVEMLRAVADLCGVDAVGMGKPSCINAILENF
jgi:hypothetical protein